MKFTDHQISEDAIGAGYPGKSGWHVITDEAGTEIATAHPEYADAITKALNLMGNNSTDV